MGVLDAGDLGSTLRSGGAWSLSSPHAAVDLGALLPRCPLSPRPLDGQLAWLPDLAANLRPLPVPVPRRATIAAFGSPAPLPVILGHVEPSWTSACGPPGAPLAFTSRGRAGHPADLVRCPSHAYGAWSACTPAGVPLSHRDPARGLSLSPVASPLRPSRPASPFSPEHAVLSISAPSSPCRVPGRVVVPLVPPLRFQEADKGLPAHLARSLTASTSASRRTCGGSSSSSSAPWRNPLAMMASQPDGYTIVDRSLSHGAPLPGARWRSATLSPAASPEPEMRNIGNLGRAVYRGLEPSRGASLAASPGWPLREAPGPARGDAAHPGKGSPAPGPAWPPMSEAPSVADIAWRAEPSPAWPPAADVWPSTECERWTGERAEQAEHNIKATAALLAAAASSTTGLSRPGPAHARPGEALRPPSAQVPVESSCRADASFTERLGAADDTLTLEEAVLLEKRCSVSTRAWRQGALESGSHRPPARRIFQRGLHASEVAAVVALLSQRCSPDLGEQAGREFDWAVSVRGDVPGSPGCVDYASALTALRQLTYLNGLPALDTDAARWFFDSAARRRADEGAPGKPELLQEEFQSAVRQLLQAAVSSATPAA